MLIRLANLFKAVVRTIKYSADDLPSHIPEEIRNHRLVKPIKSIHVHKAIQDVIPDFKYVTTDVIDKYSILYNAIEKSYGSSLSATNLDIKDTDGRIDKMNNVVRQVLEITKKTLSEHKIKYGQKSIDSGLKSDRGFPIVFKIQNNQSISSVFKALDKFISGSVDEARGIDDFPEYKSLIHQLSTNTENVGDKPIVCIFSTNPIEIMTMSSRSEWTSCQDILNRGGYSEDLNRAVETGLHNNSGIIYLTDQTKAKHHPDMNHIISRSLVFLVTDGSKNALFLPVIYGNIDNGRIFIEAIKAHCNLDVFYRNLPQQFYLEHDVGAPEIDGFDKPISDIVKNDLEYGSNKDIGGVSIEHPTLPYLDGSISVKVTSKDLAVRLKSMNEKTSLDELLQIEELMSSVYLDHSSVWWHRLSELIISKIKDFYDNISPKHNLLAMLKYVNDREYIRTCALYNDIINKIFLNLDVWIHNLEKQVDISTGSDIILEMLMYIKQHYRNRLDKLLLLPDVARLCDDPMFDSSMLLRVINSHRANKQILSTALMNVNCRDDLAMYIAKISNYSIVRRALDYSKLYNYDNGNIQLLRFLASDNWTPRYILDIIVDNPISDKEVFYGIIYNNSSSPYAKNKANERVNAQ